MVIAIEQHQIAWREEGIEHHFVGRGGAVQHEVGFIRIKDFCRMLLGDAWRAFMDQQIAHCHVGIAQIGAEKRFAKEIDKLVSGRMAAEELASLMSGAVKRTVPLLDVIDQRAEERRAELGFVLLRSRFKLASVVRIAGVGVLKNAVNTRQKFSRNPFFFMRGNKHRNTESRGFYFFYGAIENIADGQNHGCHINIIRCGDIHNVARSGKAFRAGTADGNF